ncbi:MAG TPA: GntR family transcriptional regulator, partial [Longimicrobiaceae bacterium]|nr:GntR family transcriptional regulator [Longimicrobiaceae bacterium]
RAQLVPVSHVIPVERLADPGVAHLNLRCDGSSDLYDTLRRSILAAVHEGAAQAGDRLPSIRDVADACETTTYSAVQAYKALEDEGIVEKRERSGVFIASLGETPVRRLPETATWLRGVVADGYLLQVKLPGLPDLIENWTASAPLRCACVESSEDYRVALCEEIRGQFGLEALDVPAVAQEGGASPARLDSIESAVRRADLIVTTPFHLPRVRSLAARLDIPLVVATLDDASANAIARRARVAEEVVLICVDPAFGRRMTINLRPDERARARVVALADGPDLRQIDRDQPVLLTKAARRRLSGEEFRLVLPQYPGFSRRFAERLAHTIIQLNLEAMRRAPRMA